MAVRSVLRLLRLFLCHFRQLFHSLSVVPAGDAVPDDHLGAADRANSPDPHALANIVCLFHRVAGLARLSGDFAARNAMDNRPAAGHNPAFAGLALQSLGLAGFPEAVSSHIEWRTGDVEAGGRLYGHHGVFSGDFA
ncbi:MAG: hypothetical protein U5J78_03295 [Parasphingorhabdus sp.]|nr:hypothetical protein [Parasphingorhabdus sp.]